MRILYVATDQPVPGTHGGSVHVLSVARGLARLGHEVHVAAKGRRFSAPRTERIDGVNVFRCLRFLPAKGLRFASAPAVLRAARRIRPDVVIERYYNFGGEGALAARRLGVPLVLEVNSPMREPPGTLKDRLDRSLLAGRMRRWRETIAARAAMIVTPLPAILPEGTPADKVLELPWGADTDQFDPEKAAPHESLADLVGERSMVVFASSFRPWHGVRHLAEAARVILKEQRRRDVVFVLVGEGPLVEWARRFSIREDVQESFCCVGPVPHAEMPRILAGARLAVAPFDTGAHPYLRLGFYWSPLKVFEAMAMGLPVVTCAIPPLDRIVRDGVEGVLYREGDTRALAGAITRLLDDAFLAGELGRAGRERVVDEFSWRGHCERLDEVLRSLVPASRE